MKTTEQHLAAISEDTAYLNANQVRSAALVEPELGARAARRFINAIVAGDVKAEDAWPFVCSHLHHWNPSEDPRLQGFINELAASATSAARPT